MKIAIFDDIHTEFGPWHIPKLDADVIVLAGDIATKPAEYAAVARAVREKNPQADVVAILGNHELYGNEFTSAPAKYARALGEIDRVHFLNNSTVTIKGTTFAGTTLWTDLSQGNDAMSAEYAMNDYKNVRHIDAQGNYRKLRAADTTKAHLEAVAFLTETLTNGNPERTVVVTHHAPSWRSTPHHEGFEKVYCAQLDELIEKQGPALWVHGHVHKSHNYTIGNTLIRNNPRGYVGAEMNVFFQEDLVLDLPALSVSDPAPAKTAAPAVTNVESAPTEKLSAFLFLGEERGQLKAAAAAHFGQEFGALHEDENLKQATGPIIGIGEHMFFQAHGPHHYMEHRKPDHFPFTVGDFVTVTHTDYLKRGMRVQPTPPGIDLARAQDFERVDGEMNYRVFEASGYRLKPEWINEQQIKPGGSYTGEIRTIGEHFAAQDVGRGKYVIHDNAKLDRPVESGEYLSISYDGAGMGKVRDRDIGNERAVGL